MNIHHSVSPFEDCSSGSRKLGVLKCFSQITFLFNAQLILILREKVGGKHCPGPKCCLPRARPVNWACRSASGIETMRWVSRSTAATSSVYLCQAPRRSLSEGSGRHHRFSPKLRQLRHRFSVV